MDAQVRRLAAVFGAAFLAVVLAAGYWGFVRSEDLQARGDNPRRILDERRTARGTIYDRADQVLAESTGAPGALTRYYHYPALAPVVGYVSPLYGLAGVEAALDEALHGGAGLDPFDLFWQGSVLGEPPTGRDVRLTLDLTVQQAADAALAERAGAVVVLDIRSGHLLALATHPTYDANTLEADWGDLVADSGAPLLNRATLGLYQPGGALWPVTLAAAAEHEPDLLSQAYPDATLPIALNGEAYGCRVTPALERLTVRESLLFGCPGPIGAVGQALGPEALEAIHTAFEMFTPPSLAIQATASAAAPVTEAARAAVGLEGWTVTPLRVALALAAVAGDGTLPAPQLVLATQGANGIWRPEPPEGAVVTAISPEAAARVKALLPEGGYLATAPGSAGGGVRAWYLGFGPQTETRYVVVVLLEDGDTVAAQAIGRGVLAQALAAQR